MNQDAKDFRERRLNGMPEAERNSVIWEIQRESENLREIYLGCAERAIKSLFLLNAGGVVTVLAYIYHANTPCTSLLLTFALSSFLVGLVCAFVVIIIDFYAVLNRWNVFRVQVHKFNRDEISFDEIKQFQESSSDRSKAANMMLFCGVISAVSVVMGIILGFLGYLSA